MPKLLEQLRTLMRLRHYTVRTEEDAGFGIRFTCRLIGNEVSKRELGMGLAIRATSRSTDPVSGITGRQHIGE